MDSDDDYNVSDMEEDQPLQFLTSDELKAEMNEAIVDVQSILEMNTGVCRILLHKFKWNKDSLVERFYDSPDTHAFLVAAQVLPKDTPPPAFPTVPADTVECEICWSGETKLTGLACGHRACGDCWKCYLTEKIVDGRQCEIECMMPKCDIFVEDEKVHYYINDKSVLTLYDQLTIDSYVQANIFLKWCPGANCGLAVKLPDCERHIIACPCGTNFCSSCGNDTHEPINCDLLKAWLKRNQSDAESFNWIAANTKDCPKCHTSIEKNGGCNHMSCRSSSCRYEFCWLCMGSWKDHSGARCNTYTEDDSKRGIATRNLKRYLFYHDRYKAHGDSLKLEAGLNDRVLAIMEQMKEYGMTYVEVQFLKKAVTALSTCRRTLMYTYPFAFYLQKDCQSEIFETNQSDLQMATEELSRFLERDLDVETVRTLQVTIEDKIRYVERRRNCLLDHCAEGVNKGFWKYNKELL